MDLLAFEELLKKMNNGILRGAKRKLSQKMKINESLIGRIVNGKQAPSEKLLKEMSKLLSTSENNLQKIFDLSGSNNTFGNNSPVQINYNDQLEKEIKLKDEEIKFLKEQVEFYKSKKGGKK